jgi:hypothetical protein
VPDECGNLHPVKQRPEEKIDTAEALMIAIGRAMAENGESDFAEFLRDPLFAG